MVLTKKIIVDHLISDDPKETAALFKQADAVRERYVGKEVHLRGIIEFSNYCAQNCLYCGLRRANKSIKRYRMTYDEIYRTAQEAAGLGLKTVVLQSGEDGYYKIRELCGLVEKIKKLGLVVTLSIGERTHAEYRWLKGCGADRYLLRFETSDPRLYGYLRPGCELKDRLRCIGWLKELGYEAGSGIMAGLPGQTAGSIADDIVLFKALDLDMIGIGPFIAHPHTPLAGAAGGSTQLVLKTVALTRIMTKNTNIPATTALGTIDSAGRRKALECGANVIMPNCTPMKYRKLYQIYPDKICLTDDAKKCRGCVAAMIKKAGRMISQSAGNRVPLRRIR